MRFLKLLRYFEITRLLIDACHKSAEAVPVLSYMMALIVLISATFIYLFEERSNIPSMPHSLWLAVVTMTTVPGIRATSEADFFFSGFYLGIGLIQKRWYPSHGHPPTKLALLPGSVGQTVDSSVTLSLVWLALPEIFPAAILSPDNQVRVLALVRLGLLWTSVTAVLRRWRCWRFKGDEFAAALPAGN